MASTNDVAAQPAERCPDCGSPFARDLKQRGFRRHRERRSKHGSAVVCGGTSDSWGKGGKS
jgi:hypothetical protein